MKAEDIETAVKRGRGAWKELRELRQGRATCSLWLEKPHVIKLV